MFLEQGVLPPTAGLATPLPPTPAGPVKSPLIQRFGEETAMGTYLKYARHRSSSPKPLSERSQNPKTWGNWEGIGDFCLQKCQRGRQLSPLSEATGLDRNSLRSFRKSLKRRGVAPYGDLLRKLRLSPGNGSIVQSSHAIASQAQSRCLNVTRTRKLGAIGRGLAISACRNAKGGDS